MPTIGKFATLRDAILNNKPILSFARQDFLDAAFAYADSLRTRKAPEDVAKLEDAVLETLRILLPLRDQFIDWIELEGSGNPSAFEETLINFLKRLLALRYRSTDLQSWSDGWFDGHVIFVYEVFLYVIAALVRQGQFALIHVILGAHYMLPDTELHRNREFVGFEEFYGYSHVLAQRNARLKLQRMNLVADLIKERSTRADITFRDVMQAELIVFIAAALADARWLPADIDLRRLYGALPTFRSCDAAQVPRKSQNDVRRGQRK